LLHLARAGADGGARVTPIDVEAALRDRVGAWQPVAQDRGVTIVLNAAADTAALATPDHLPQVLDNLIANAIDVSRPRGRVWLSSARDDGWVEIHVADEGPGMSADRRARAFDRFSSRGKSSGGFGIGLAIANRLVTIDGGQLDLLNAPTGGLDARIRLRPAVAGVRPEE
jgi:signal transduction histidine kinase